MIPFFDQESICHSQLIRSNGKTRLGNDVGGNIVNDSQQREAAKKQTRKSVTRIKDEWSPCPEAGVT